MRCWNSANNPNFSCWVFGYSNETFSTISFAKEWCFALRSQHELMAHYFSGHNNPKIQKPHHDLPIASTCKSKRINVHIWVDWPITVSLYCRASIIFLPEWVALVITHQVPAVLSNCTGTCMYPCMYCRYSLHVIISTNGNVRLEKSLRKDKKNFRSITYEKRHQSPAKSSKISF